MISEKDIKTMRGLFLEAFPDCDEAEREKMLNDLVTRYPNPVPFCVMNGMHIARIGIRYEIGDCLKGSFYYATDYDNELLDL